MCGHRSRASAWPSGQHPRPQELGRRHGPRSAGPSLALPPGAARAGCSGQASSSGEGPRLSGWASPGGAVHLAQLVAPEESRVSARSASWWPHAPPPGPPETPRTDRKARQDPSTVGRRCGAPHSAKPPRGLDAGNELTETGTFPRARERTKKIHVRRKNQSKHDKRKKI